MVDFPQELLLEDNETILLVDDYPDLTGMLRDFLEKCGFAVSTANSASELYKCLEEKHIALILLDIGLPDANGAALLPRLKKRDSDLSVIMLTAVTKLEIALDCLRKGADDYLTKPVQFDQLLERVRKVLEKRRLSIRNRQYQKEIEEARFRFQLSHELALQMNSAHLGPVELDRILQALLVGITAREGLQFNRAFLALFDEQDQHLKGRMAIGPPSGELGEQTESSVPGSVGIVNGERVNGIVRKLQVDGDERDHILIRAARERRSINVVNGIADVEVSSDLVTTLGEDTFVVVPLFSPKRSLGVIIADHCVTRAPITEERIIDLESFAGQASLAIEHCRLYMAMESKIAQLEAMTEELEKNKDLLVETERYSAVGHMAAQLAHSIRNPVTSIGGTARLLTRKTDDPDWLKFLKMMAAEAEKVERILQDLFSFVEQAQPEFEMSDLGKLLHKSLMLHFTALQRQGVEYSLRTPEHEVLVRLDPRLLYQALAHLFRNSLEAMPDGGELEVKLLENDRDVCVFITDSGRGLATVGQEQATTPFFTTKTLGTGMGLTLVKRIIDDHGGVFRLESLEDGGTRAIVCLPR
ncbi:MAG: histidine kinase [Desulfobulbus propionicus]|nr:MAG: histidine kinase [Desulfobulbus propionicus]